MRGKAIWIELCVLAVLLILLAGRFAYFPGDVALERLAQSLVPKPLKWAQWVTLTASFPWSLVLLGVTFALSLAIAGWRAAFLSLASFGGMWLLGMWLSPAIARPRPSPNLVHVVGSPSGYTFPSIFALTYASTIGFLVILAVMKSSGVAQTALLICCCLLLVIGGIARIALGAHWPSDVAVSYFLGLLWGAFLIGFAAPD